MGARHRAVGRGTAGDDPRRARARPRCRIRPDIPQFPEDALINATRRQPIIVLALVGLFAAACGPTAPSASPSTAAASSAPSASVTDSPAAPTATTAPTVTPSPSAAAVSCDLKPQTGTLPSDRLTGVQILGVP